MRTHAQLTAVFALACCALVALAPARRASAHKFHTSFAEADYNASAGTLEVTLRTFPDDLSDALSRRAGRRVALDDKKEAGGHALRYLRDTFRLKDARGETAELQWVGMDFGVDSAWLYFEAKLPAGLEGAELSNSFLFELFEDQINLVNVKSNGRKLALRFARGDGAKAVTPK
jgi:hypothetical protein